MADGAARARAAFRRLIRAVSTAASSSRFGTAGGAAPRHEQPFEGTGGETDALLEGKGRETAGRSELTEATARSSRLGTAGRVVDEGLIIDEETGGETCVSTEVAAATQRSSRDQTLVRVTEAMTDTGWRWTRPIADRDGNHGSQVDHVRRIRTGRRIGSCFVRSWFPLYWIVWWYRNFYWISIAALGWWSLPFTTSEGGTGWQVYLVYALLLMVHMKIEWYLMGCLTNDECPDLSPVVRLSKSFGFSKQASVAYLLVLSFIDHLDGHRDAWSISFLLKSDSQIHESWLNTWRTSAIPAVEALTPFFDRARFSGFMLWQFLSFTAASQWLALGPMKCCELAGYLICVWAPDLVQAALGDAEFTVMTLVVVAVGVPVPLSRLAMLWAWCRQGEGDTFEDFVSRYGMTGLFLIMALKVFNEFIYCPLLFINQAWLNSHVASLLASDEFAHIECTIKCSGGASLIAFSTLCAGYSSNSYGCDSDLVELQGVRFSVNKAIMENCRELWMLASLFSFTKASMGPVAQAKLLALFVFGLISVMAKVKDYLHCLRKYYGRGTSVLKTPDPPAQFWPSEYPSIEDWKDEWIQYGHEVEENAVRQCLYDWGTCLALIVGAVIAVLAGVKVCFAFYCASSVWNLTTGCVPVHTLLQGSSP